MARGLRENSKRNEGEWEGTRIGRRMRISRGLRMARGMC
jgi:hypothetical protein